MEQKLQQIQIIPPNDDEQEIDLLELCKYVFSKWKLIVAAAVVCALIGAGIGMYKGADNSEAQSEYDTKLVEYNDSIEKYNSDIRNYENQLTANDRSIESANYSLESTNDYVENSIRYQIDPNSVVTAAVSLYVDTGYQIMPGTVYQNPDKSGTVLNTYYKLLQAQDTLQQAAKQLGKDERYLKELVSIDINSNLLTISVIAGDEKTAETILDAELEKFYASQDVVSTAVCEHTVSVISRSSTTAIATSLRDEQQNVRDSLISLQNQLDTLNTTHDSLEQSIKSAQDDLDALSEPTLEAAAGQSGKFALIGCLIGAVLVCGVYCVLFLLDNRVRSEKWLLEAYPTVPLIAAVPDMSTGSAAKAK